MKNLKFSLVFFQSNTTCQVSVDSILNINCTSQLTFLLLIFQAIRSKLDNPHIDGGLLDSLDTNTNKSNYFNNTHTHTTSNNNTNSNPYQQLNSTSNANYQHQQSKPLLYEQQLQQPQLPQPPPPPQTHFQPVQPLQPFQFAQGGIFLIPSPSSNALVNSTPQFQFLSQPAPNQQALQVVTQQQQPQPPTNMFYQEPIQPLFYNTAYPLNLAGTSNYYPQQTDYISDPYNYQSTDELTAQYKLQKQRQLLSNRTNGAGTKYDAQPLVPPSHAAQPRGAPQTYKSNYNPLSQQSSDSFEGGVDNNSPESYNADENELMSHELGSLKIQDDDYTKAQMWNKLQQANRDAGKEKSGKKKNGAAMRDFQNGGLPPVALKPPSYKKPPPSEPRKNEPNYLEKNKEAIKNKENLSHRYPDKKYENVHGKNINQRIKRIQG